ncbi:MAG TPA: S9 family peptidase, partial [Chthonomonadaceae bacterium]|nr:S9 family peptidase [Chthonomonadaceae bacterium]
RRAAVPGDPALYVYTLATQELKRVTRSGQPHRNAKWSPDSRQIGYVRGDDLYRLDLTTGTETRLTDTAAPTLYNGRFGWVYEEEFGLIDGWDWSPDGKTIAYFQVDESRVPIVPITDYNDRHLRPVLTRYPKAGDPNPIVKIGLITVPAVGASVPPTRWADLGPDTDIYITRMQWTPQGDLLLHRMPRLQNRIELLKVAPDTGRSVVILTEEEKTWVDARSDLTFLKDRAEFLWPSYRTGYNHLYLYDLSGNLIRPLTQGNWDVDAVCGVDAAHRLLYFTAARPDPRERQLYSVLLDGGGEIVPLSDLPGEHRPYFSPDGAYYLDTHSSRAMPPHTRLYRASGQRVAVVHENPMPKPEKARPGQWEFTTFQTGDGVTLHAALLKPPDFDPKKRYPALMTSYGGPGAMRTYGENPSQQVLNAYGIGGGWYETMAQRGYILAMVDGRGTEGRGREFITCVYQNLGHWETHDQIEGAKWLGRLPYVDAKRIGFWGWSYGGYLACLCLLLGASVFKTGIAVAPVTDWALYDSLYTERYMRRPQDNPKGYAESAPLTHADKLRGSFLLVHGTADDNVHFQHTARLAAALQQHEKAFRMMVYPGRHHGLEGVSQHLYSLLTDFVTANL